jgi:hypothetical protein
MMLEVSENEDKNLSAATGSREGVRENDFIGSSS